MSHRAMLPKNMSEEAGTAWLIGIDLSVEKRKPLLTTIAQKNALALTKLHARVFIHKAVYFFYISLGYIGLLILATAVRSI